MPATEFSTLRWYIFGNIVPVKFFVYTTYIWNMSQDSRKYIAQNVTVNITIDRLEQIAKILDVDVINLLEH